MTLVGKSAYHLGVRPIRIGSTFRDHPEGAPIYSFNVKQCRKLLNILDDAGA